MPNFAMLPASIAFDSAYAYILDCENNLKKMEIRAVDAMVAESQPGKITALLGFKPMSKAKATLKYKKSLKHQLHEKASQRLRFEAEKVLKRATRAIDLGIPTVVVPEVLAYRFLR